VGFFCFFFFFWGYSSRKSFGNLKENYLKGISRTVLSSIGGTARVKAAEGGRDPPRKDREIDLLPADAFLGEMPTRFHKNAKKRNLRKGAVADVDHVTTDSKKKKLNKR